MNEPCQQHAKIKEPYIEDHLVYDSVSMNHIKWASPIRKTAKSDFQDQRKERDRKLLLTEHWIAVFDKNKNKKKKQFFIHYIIGGTHVMVHCRSLDNFVELILSYLT